MRWLKRNIWKAGIVLAGMLSLLVLIVWVPVSAAGAYEGMSGLATPGTVQATPTVDPTMTTLQKEQLVLQNKQLTQQENWLWSNGATILSSFLSTLVVVVGVLIGFRQWSVGRQDAQDKELKDRHDEREKRAEERFQFVAEALGSKDRERQVGAAIMLRTFLQPGYEQFYRQTFDLAVVHLQMRKANQVSSRSTLSQRLFTMFHLRDGQQHQQDAVSPIPMDVLSQALIIVFQEAFPRARRWVEKQLASESKKFDPRILNASNILLDNAYLSQADFSGGWLLYASFQNADLSGADLSGANLTWANLVEADLSKADLSKANLNGAYLFDANLNGANLSEANLSGANLEGAKLYGVEGLTKEQLERYQAKGAVVGKDTTTRPPQSPVSPSPPSQSNDAQAPSVPSAQESSSTSGIDGSSAASSESDSQS